MPGKAARLLVLGVCIFVNIITGLESFSTGNEWLDTLLGLWIRVNEYSYFPFISWFFFPILGYGLAFCFQKVKMRTALLFALITGAELFFFSEWMIRSGRMMDAALFNVLEIEEGFYYDLHPLYALAGYGIIALEFVLAHLVMKLCRNQLHPVLMTMSRNVTQIYVVQWVVIGFLSPVLAQMTNIWSNILAALFVLFVSYFGGKMLKKANLIRV